MLGLSTAGVLNPCPAGQFQSAAPHHLAVVLPVGPEIWWQGSHGTGPPSPNSQEETWILCAESTKQSQHGVLGRVSAKPPGPNPSVL